MTDRHLGTVISLYDGRTENEWIDELARGGNWMKRHALAAFALLERPQSLLDVGCGLGDVVQVAGNLGVRAFGVDQLISKDEPPEGGGFFHHNLVEKFTLVKPVTMVWCTEVAEHLDPSAHATLCDTCADNLLEGRGNYLIFSSAHPSQGGTEHLSERPAKYWKDQFAMRQLGYRHDLTVNLALLWSNLGSPLYWLAANVMVFEK